MSLLLLYVGVALAFSFLCSLMEATLLSVTPSYVAALETRHRTSPSCSGASRRTSTAPWPPS